MKVIKPTIKTLAITLTCLILSKSALGCTSVVVGSEATKDGSLIIARTADGSAFRPAHLTIYPATKGVKGMYYAKDHNHMTDFSYPLPENGLRYSAAPNWKTKVRGSTGFNEAGVGFSGTETIYAKPEALKNDPYNTQDGITEDDIPGVVLPRVHSAREGVQLIGGIIETIGAGEGFGIILVDEKESWYLETGSGHHFLAQRTPKDKYLASANQGRLTTYIEGDDNFIASKGLVQYAIDNGLYKKEEGEFNFTHAYARDGDKDLIYNYPRVWQMQKILTPSLKQDVMKGVDMPNYVKPDNKLTVNDIKKVFRNHFETGELSKHDPYSKGLKGNSETFRPISIFRTYQSHIMQVRPWLPRAIGEVTYFGQGMPDLAIYIPIYAGMSHYPKSWAAASNKADRHSPYWKFRKLQTLVMTDYPKLAPIVKAAYAKLENDIAKRQVEFEKEYLELIKTDKEAAQKALDDFCMTAMNDAEELTLDLTDEAFTIRTQDIETLNKFMNRNKAD